MYMELKLGMKGFAQFWPADQLMVALFSCINSFAHNSLVIYFLGVAIPQKGDKFTHMIHKNDYLCTWLYTFKSKLLYNSLSAFSNMSSQLRKKTTICSKLKSRYILSKSLSEARCNLQ